jgi:hypothetical protein
VTWKPGLSLEPLCIDQNYISCLVISNSQNSSWLISCVYAPHSLHNQTVFWSSLSELGNSFAGGF